VSISPEVSRSRARGPDGNALSTEQRRAPVAGVFTFYDGTAFSICTGKKPAAPIDECIQ